MLSDRQIRELGNDGCVIPYREENLQPASLDFALHDEFVTFPSEGVTAIDLLDVNDDAATTPAKRINGEPGIIIHPGEFMLGASDEVLALPSWCAARIEGKSSLGRLGLFVHVTAGFIDPGFNGRVTLELFNARRVPIILRPGKLICQIGFFRMETQPEKSYQGRYQGDTTAVASRYGQHATKAAARRANAGKRV